MGWGCEPIPPFPGESLRLVIDSIHGGRNHRIPSGGPFGVPSPAIVTRVFEFVAALAPVGSYDGVESKRAGSGTKDGRLPSARIDVLRPHPLQGCAGVQRDRWHSSF